MMILLMSAVDGIETRTSLRSSSPTTCGVELRYRSRDANRSDADRLLPMGTALARQGAGQHMNQAPMQTSDEADLLMIVDDDPGVCQSLERVLRREGYETISARNGRAALGILHGGRVLPPALFLHLMT